MSRNLSHDIDLCLAAADAHCRRLTTLCLLAVAGWLVVIGVAAAPGAKPSVKCVEATAFLVTDGQGTIHGGLMYGADPAFEGPLLTLVGEQDGRGVSLGVNDRAGGAPFVRIGCETNGASVQMSVPDDDARGPAIVAGAGAGDPKVVLGLGRHETSERLIPFAAVNGPDGKPRTVGTVSPEGGVIEIFRKNGNCAHRFDARSQP